MNGLYFLMQFNTKKHTWALYLFTPSSTRVVTSDIRGIHNNISTSLWDSPVSISIQCMHLVYITIFHKASSYNKILYFNAQFYW